MAGPCNQGCFGCHLRAGGAAVVRARVRDFFAEWCGPCKAMAPALEQVASEMQGKLKVVKLDVDQNPTVTQQYRIQAMPTLMIFKNGQVAAQRVGALVQKKQLEDWIKGAIDLLGVAGEGDLRVSAGRAVAMPRAGCGDGDGPPLGDHVGPHDPDRVSKPRAGRRGPIPGNSAKRS